MTYTATRILLITTAALVLITPAKTGACTPGLCVRCALVTSTTDTYSCQECINSLLASSSTTAPQNDGTCTGTATGINNCVKTGFVGTVIRCTECLPNFGLQTDAAGVNSCVATGITNCYRSTRNSAGVETCLLCNNGFSLNSNNCNTAATPITNCVATTMNGAAVVCAKCTNGFTVAANGQCIGLPDSKCLDNNDGFTQNGYCSTCNYPGGFYAVRATSSGTQLCSNGDGSEFNPATTATTSRPNILQVIMQSRPGFSQILGFAYIAIFVGVSM